MFWPLLELLLTWGNRILGTALFVLVFILLLGRLNVHQTTLLRQLEEPRKVHVSEGGNPLLPPVLLSKLGENRLGQKTASTPLSPPQEGDSPGQCGGGSQPAWSL